MSPFARVLSLLAIDAVFGLHRPPTTTLPAMPVEPACQGFRQSRMWDAWMEFEHNEAFPSKMYTRQNVVNGPMHYLFLPLGKMYLDEKRAECLAGVKSQDAPSFARSTEELRRHEQMETDGWGDGVWDAAMHHGVVQAFKSSLESQRAMGFLVAAQNRSKLLTTINRNSPQDRVAEFDDVWFDDAGCIGSPGACRLTLNGGCYAGAGMCSAEARSLQETKNETQEFPLVIGVDSNLQGHWHTIAESFVALAHVDTTDAMIHMKKDESTLYFLSLLNISEDRVVEGPVFAKKLIVPEKARCGSPSIDQVLFLRNLLIKEAGGEAKADKVILISRRKRRARNTEDVADLIAGWAASKTYEFYHHDEKALQPWEEQIASFSSAKVIIGPAGEGSTFMIAAPQGATYIEYDNDCGRDWAYMRLAAMLGFNYYGMRYEPGNLMDIDRLSLLLESL